MGILFYFEPDLIKTFSIWLPGAQLSVDAQFGFSIYQFQ